MVHRLLFSGGKDSLLSLYRLQHLKPVLHYVKTGHFSEPKELEALDYYADKFGLLKATSSLSLSMPPGMSSGDGTDNHVPLRNALFLAHCVNRYYQEDDAVIWYLGFPKINPHPFKDGGSNYIPVLNEMVNLVYPHIEVKSSIGNIWAENVLGHLLRIKDVDVSKMWLCDRNGADTEGKMCGICFKCKLSLDFMKRYHYFSKVKHLYYGH